MMRIIDGRSFVCQVKKRGIIFISIVPELREKQRLAASNMYGSRNGKTMTHSWSNYPIGISGDMAHFYVANTFSP